MSAVLLGIKKTKITMKIMYVDASIDGHHRSYLKALLEAAEEERVEAFAVLPEFEKTVNGKCYSIPKSKIRTFSGYWMWMKQLKKIAEDEKPDILHLLDGDSIMRYFGWGFSGFRQCKTVITFHHLFSGRLRTISMKNMLRQMDVGVFHTEEIASKVKGDGCKNVFCIPYPCFLNTSLKEEDGYKNHPPVLLALGGTRYDKGLDVLLEALKFVTMSFQLTIAGREEDFDRQFIEEKTRTYVDSVNLKLDFLTEEEVLEQLQCSDIIVLPYRRIFDGASGPMCEGVYLGKTIVGPNHGSLGRLILQYHVGYTFASEDAVELGKCLNKALNQPFVYDETAKGYQESLRPEFFKRSYMELYKRLILERK